MAPLPTQSSHTEPVTTGVPSSVILVVVISSVLLLCTGVATLLLRRRFKKARLAKTSSGQADLSVDVSVDVYTVRSDEVVEVPFSPSKEPKCFSAFSSGGAQTVVNLPGLVTSTDTRRKDGGGRNALPSFHSLSPIVLDVPLSESLKEHIPSTQPPGVSATLKQNASIAGQYTPPMSPLAMFAAFSAMDFDSQTVSTVPFPQLKILDGSPHLHSLELTNLSSCPTATSVAVTAPEHSRLRHSPSMVAETINDSSRDFFEPMDVDGLVSVLRSEPISRHAIQEPSQALTLATVPGGPYNAIDSPDPSRPAVTTLDRPPLTVPATCSRVSQVSLVSTASGSAHEICEDSGYSSTGPDDVNDIVLADLHDDDHPSDLILPSLPLAAGLASPYDGLSEGWDMCNTPVTNWATPLAQTPCQIASTPSRVGSSSSCASLSSRCTLTPMTLTTCYSPRSVRSIDSQGTVESTPMQVSVGRVLQPLFETLDHRENGFDSPSDTASKLSFQSSRGHLSVLSLESAFSLGRAESCPSSPMTPTQATVASSSRSSPYSSSDHDPIAMDQCMQSREVLPSRIPRIVTSRTTGSQVDAIDVTPICSPTFSNMSETPSLSSYPERPLAPTPGSFVSRLSLSPPPTPSPSIEDANSDAGLATPRAPSLNVSCRSDRTYTTSPFVRPCAPTPGSLRSRLSFVGLAPEVAGEGLTPEACFALRSPAMSTSSIVASDNGKAEVSPSLSVLTSASVMSSSSCHIGPVDLSFVRQAPPSMTLSPLTLRAMSPSLV